MKHPISFTLLFYSLFLIQSFVIGQETEMVGDERVTNAEPAHAHYMLEDGRWFAITFLPSRDLPSTFVYAFDFQPEWDGKQVFVKLPEITSPFSFKINGFTYGFGGDQGRVVEFNLTPLLSDGPNEISLVFDETDSNLAHKPNYGGTLVLRDPVHIRDIHISNFPGPAPPEILARVTLFVQSYLTDRNTGRMLSGNILDPLGDQVGSWEHSLDYPLAFRQEVEVTFDHNIQHPMMWSPDHPDLYTLQFQLEETVKKQGEMIVCNFGIRNATLLDSLVVINEDTIVPKMMDWEDLLQTAVARADGTVNSSNLSFHTFILELIQKEGINMVSTEYPLPSGLMDLFDIHGILVLKKKSDRLPNMESSDMNRPSVIWTE